MAAMMVVHWAVLWADWMAVRTGISKIESLVRKKES